MKNKIGKKFLKISLLIIPIFYIWGGIAMSIPLPKVLLYSTVYIKNSFGNVGTGFLIAKNVKESKQGVFLITNKHILRKNGNGEFTKFIEVRFYAKNQGKSVEWVRIPILLDDGRFTYFVFMHPQEEVDVVGILMSPFIKQFQDKLNFTKLGEDLILSREVAQKKLIDAGEDLLILGYPGGIFSENNFLPLVKNGLLASSSSEDLYLKLGTKEINGKIYLIEGSLFGGNSGGPVFVKIREEVERKEDGLHQTVKIGKYIPMYLLGIQSSSIQLKEKIYTRVFNEADNTKISTKENTDKKVAKDATGEYIEIEKEIMLNVVFSSEYIKDIFDVFLKQYEAAEVVAENQPK